jgi:rfaE bifunctional protein nucleotidyltransferase chain/domain
MRIKPNNKDFNNFEEFNLLLDSIKKKKQRIVLCHGVFDLFHPGHLYHLQAAKKLGEILIVSLTTDRHVNKGPGRPLFNQEIRMDMLSNLEFVDYVILSDFSSAEQIINFIKPDFYVKGADYLDQSKDVTNKIILEKSIVESFGGVIKYTDELSSSSSKLINKFFNNLPYKSKDWLEFFKSTGGLELTENWLEKLSDLRVLILGESIIDTYTTCSALAKTSKDPLLAFNIHETRSYIGGVLAIADNCQAWTNKVTTITFSGLDDEIRKIINIHQLKSADIVIVKCSDRPSIEKHRYIDVHSNTKVFESYKFELTNLTEKDSDKIKAEIDNRLSQFDLVIVADYGHGFFSSSIVESLTKSSAYLAVNTQSNAGNRGFNTISKYSRANMISLNGSEIQLEIRNLNPNYNVIVPELLDKLNANLALVTLGSEGLNIFSGDKNELIPALATRIVDKVGGGDAVFAISAMLSKIGAPISVIGFVSNIVAAHEISQIGHGNPMSLGDIKKHAKTLLA